MASKEGNCSGLIQYGQIYNNDLIRIIKLELIIIKQLIHMQKVINRFWDWLFHPSIKLYANTNLKADVYRYPSPGNAVNIPLAGEQYSDYKTPYEHSQYNIRYSKPTPSQKSDPIFEVRYDSPLLSPLVKLRKSGLLQAGEQDNVDAVANAKKKYIQKFGVSVDQKAYRNDVEYNFAKSADRQELSATIHSFYQNLKEAKYTGYDYSQDRKTIDDPEVMPLQSVDMFVDPHFQQGRISNEYMIEHFINENTKKKNIQAHVGDARFWKAIDDSFDKHEVEKIQKHIGEEDPTNFTYRPTKINLEVDKEGNVIDVHPKH